MGAPPATATQRLRIAICGAGIGGLALAVVLGKFERPEAPIEVNLYERYPEIAMLGAGISVWQRTWRVMELLGLDKELSDAAERPPNKTMGPGFVYRRSDRTEDNYTFYRIMMPYGSSSMHRADLIQVLSRNVPSRYTTHWRKKVLRYDEILNDKGEVSHLELHFEDDSTAEADILIGADGIRSTVRTSMYDIAHRRDCPDTVDRAHCLRCSPATPTWDGVVAYRTLVSTEKLKKINPEHDAFRSTLCVRALHASS
ncbi:uncharacterized protein B0H18DRAFT_582726 [Fomitopsis serialis]|uniref:uncharacterized protein n=1 Tax=Fomitopsis serialis TaxID=139415 RepID=UPI002008D766|nr:uncharacterized protein B0H18DRAFT_582726 [Neoantrodia serialis]KAH9920772.1 hypothetical protein B0H18DRAFT_582726 [Neoantrodia serialis]